MKYKIKTNKNYLSPNKLSLALAMSLGISQAVHAQFANPFELSSLNIQNGFVINGENDGDLSGNSISSAGDVNGDGIDDLIIGAVGADSNGNSDTGSSYVIFGSPSGLPNPLNLSSINSSSGFKINGENAGDNSGRSVSSAGDVNDDGLDDLIIGAAEASPNGNYSGSSYVVFGSSSSLPSPLNLSNINGVNGFKINGENAFDSSGTSVSSAGDVNGDGIDDLIIGAYYADPNGNATGSSYVVFGSSSSLPSPLNLSNINGVNGFKINGENVADISGRSVSSAGDVNGDGVDDLIIGADYADPNGNYSGSSYVVFGSSSSLPSPLNLSNINGVNGFKINGENAFDFSGNSVSSAGDVNGDGVGDLIIGARAASANGNSGAGSSYVVFGSSSSLLSPLNLTSLNGLNGFKINGENANDSSGKSVSSAGDVNGDGVDDLIIGANGADSSAGSSYVVFGSSSSLPSLLNLTNLNGVNGFKINGENAFDGSGTSVSSAGDVNGDGVDDLIIGADNADPNGNGDAGRSYVIFGISNDIFTNGFESI